MNDKFNISQNSLSTLDETAQHNRLCYTSVPLYHPIQDHIRDCYTSITAVTKSCSLLTHASYIGHHNNTLVPYPLASDAIRAWFSQTRRLNQCRIHQWKLQQEENNKCTRETLSNNYRNELYVLKKMT
jgi:hypothetical protein